MTTALIADDHSFFRSGLSAALSSCGIKVVASVEDGESALDAIASQNPDIVVLDVRMPVMDGVSAFEALRATGDRRPVIMLTAQLRDEDLVRLMKAGVNAIVFKHSPDDQLCEAIKAVQAGKRFIDGELVDKAFALVAQGAEPSPLDALTARERQIAMEVAQGRKNREIAAKLSMTEGTVKIYLHNAYTKLGIGNRTELALLVRGQIVN